MKILCIADYVDPLVYSAQIKERFNDVDFILSAGDLPLNYYGFIVSSLNRPLYFVFGNHNLKRYHWFYKGERAECGHRNEETPHCFGSSFIDDKICYLKKHDLIIMGLGGSKNYNNGLHQFSERGMKWRMLKLWPILMYNKLRHGRYVDILLTHAPPRNLGDKDDIPHQGFEVFKEFMTKYQPKYLLHGHVHLYDNLEERENFFEKTRIINIYKHLILDID